jgi:hypothetical protein
MARARGGLNQGHCWRQQGLNWNPPTVLGVSAEPALHYAKDQPVRKGCEGNTNIDIGGHFVCWIYDWWFKRKVFSSPLRLNANVNCSKTSRNSARSAGRLLVPRHVHRVWCPVPTCLMSWMAVMLFARFYYTHSNSSLCYSQFILQNIHVSMCFKYR